jgi:voltage-gated potassium channel
MNVFNSARSIYWGVIALLIIIAAGVGGYMLIEHWPFLDALFMTVTTITTVGYQEVRPLDADGQIFTIFLVLGGVGAAFYTLSAIAANLIEISIGNIGRRRMKNRIEHLKDHFIVCGLGRVGDEIARTFTDENIPFVVVDSRSECLSRADQAGYPYLQGDATNDDILREAGIERARGLIAAVGSDADNTYITLSARGMRPDLFIEARASGPEAETKLKRAGANRIVSPYSIGARRMAMLALHPTVVDFIDIIMRRKGGELQMETLAVGGDSPLAGQTVEEARQCSKTNILAVNKKNGNLVVHPPQDEKIQAGDSLIAIGSREQLAALETFCERSR